MVGGSGLVRPRNPSRLRAAYIALSDMPRYRAATVDFSNLLHAARIRRSRTKGSHSKSIIIQSFKRCLRIRSVYASLLSSSWIAHHSRPSDARRGKHEPKPLATGLTNSRTLPGVTLPLRQRVGTRYPRQWYSWPSMPVTGIHWGGPPTSVPRGTSGGTL